jgi:protein-S-isoprenylcysteine O-methyltransferase Ste14
MARLLADFPFLILLAAGGIACWTAVALRRVSPVLGAWTDALAAALRLAGVACFAVSFLWAWDLGASRLFSGVVSTFGSYQRPTSGSSTTPWVTALGGALVLAGLGLAGWGLRVKGLGAALTAAPPKRATQPPYARIRRPIGLGAMVGAVGFTLLVQSLPVLVCLLGWLPWVILTLELEEWEMRARHASAHEYLRRTPRYFPLPPWRR